MLLTKIKMNHGYYPRSVLLAAVVCLLIQGRAAQQDLPPWTPEKEQAIEDFVAATWDCRQIVGLSFAVVYDGEVRMARGYGYEDIEQDRQADENTPFCIGSLTKAFTSTMWGVIMDESEGVYTWDTLVKDVMGENFTFSEEVRTDRATVRDLLSHKMGLAMYSNTWLIGLPEGPSRQEYCRRLEFLEPHAYIDFRQEYAYNNFMYMLTSCMAERITGMEFEDIIQQKIFDKLGMSQSLYISDIQHDKEHVPTQYVWNHNTDTMDRLDPDLLFGSVPPSEASGGLCSPAVDMAQWMLMQLGEGTLDDAEILDADIWRATTTPQFTTGSGNNKHRKPFYPAKKEEMNYGLGWGVGDYRQYRRNHHSGLVGAFNSVLGVFPDMKLAIFTNTNGPMDTYAFQEALHIYTADVVFEEELWLNETTGCTYPDPWASEAAKKSPKINTAKEPKPKQPQEVMLELPAKKPENKPEPKPQPAKKPEPKLQDILHPNPLEPKDNPPPPKPKAQENANPPRSKRSPSWLRDQHWRYEGHFGHLLLGNMSIYYNETDDFLWGTAGRIAIAKLIPFGESEEIFLLELHGALWYIPELDDPPGSHPPIRFTNLQDDQYQAIIGIAIDEVTPPLYIRGLQWDDLHEK